MITGAYKTTSAPALDIKTYTIPIKQKLDWLTSNALLRIVSSPVYAKIIGSRPVTRIYLSPLETLTNRYEKISKRFISNIEKITPFTAPPWWIAPPITIHSSKLEAGKSHKRLLKDISRKNSQVLIYTDGSGINEKIGAAAVGPTTTWSAFLGPIDSFTVYAGELYGISLATKLTLEILVEPKIVMICVDNKQLLELWAVQKAIQANLLYNVLYRPLIV